MYVNLFFSVGEKKTPTPPPFHLGACTIHWLADQSVIWLIDSYRPQSVAHTNAVRRTPMSKSVYYSFLLNPVGKITCLGMVHLIPGCLFLCLVAAPNEILGGWVGGLFTYNCITLLRSNLRNVSWPPCLFRLIVRKVVNAAYSFHSVVFACTYC